LGATQAIRLCNSCLEWLDGVLAPPNLLLALNVQVELALTQTCRLESHMTVFIECIELNSNRSTSACAQCWNQFCVYTNGLGCLPCVPPPPPPSPPRPPSPPPGGFPHVKHTDMSNIQTCTPSVSYTARHLPMPPTRAHLMLDCQRLCYR
jgi:hypothetical protein